MMMRINNAIENKTIDKRKWYTKTKLFYEMKVDLQLKFKVSSSSRVHAHNGMKSFFVVTPGLEKT